MADHSTDPDRAETSEQHPRPAPDYDLDDSLALTSPEQYRALFEDTRQEIISVLTERAATTSELAEVLGKPKGTIGHHLKVLADAGFVRVVRTRRVRALEAKYYGRTARVFWFDTGAEATDHARRLLARVADEASKVPAKQAELVFANSRQARIPEDRMHDWHRRLDELLTEFAAQPREGQVTYAMTYALYPTTRPALPADDDGAPGQPSGGAAHGTDE